MALKTRPIKGTVYTPDGKPAAGAKIQAKLNRFETDGGIVVPFHAEAKADENGDYTIDLWPNERGTGSSSYRVTVRSASPQDVSFNVVVPDGSGALSMDPLIDRPPYPPIDQAQEAIQKAQAAASTAVASAQSAVSAADSAGNDAANAVAAKEAAEQAKVDAQTIANDFGDVQGAVAAATAQAQAAAGSASNASDDATTANQASVDAQNYALAAAAESTAVRTDLADPSKGAAMVVMRDSDLVDYLTTLAQVANSGDLVDFYVSKQGQPDALYARKGAGTLDLLYTFAGRARKYSFTTDADGLMRLTGAEVGPKQATEGLTGQAGQVTRTGTFSLSGANSWTTTPGDTISGSFSGTGFRFYTRTDTNGGVWQFVIDGGAPIDVSVWSDPAVDSSNPTTAIDVVSGLEAGEHTFTATFTGADPNHAPSSGPARGWLKYDSTQGITTRWLDNAYDLAYPASKIAPSSPVGVLSVPNHYANTVGQSMSFSFTGTGLRLNHYADNRGGIWRFVIDGGPPIDISTYDAAGSTRATVVTDSLAMGEHAVTMTFVGDDPVHAPVGGVSRAWYMYDPAKAITFDVLPRTPGQTEQMLAQTSVLEWALSVRPASETTMELTWHPIHAGRSGVSRGITQRFLIDGDIYTSLASTPLTGVFRQVKSLRIEQSFRAYNANDTAGDFPMWDASISHEATGKGSILHRHRLDFLRDTYFGAGYLAMLGASTIVDKIESSRFEELGVGAPGGAPILYLAAPSGMSAKFTADRYVFVTQSRTPDESYQLGRPGSKNKYCYTNNRPDAIKTYMVGFQDQTVPAGDARAHAVEYLVAEY